ncbi:MAG: sugar ABC transporter permease [Clostridia bacterium]|nr:sugar ABC transporter permease [Clostridia bacterium]
MQEAITAEGVEPVETEEVEVGAPQPKKKKRKRFRFSKRKFKRGLFIFCMLAYPVFQFLVMWAFVNVDSILMTFQQYDTLEGWKWVGLDNYKYLFELIALKPAFKTLIVNSVLHSLVGMFIIFPLCLMISYFLCRKLPASGFFRVIFYLPSIIPLVVLALGFSNMVSGSDSIIYKLYEGFNLDDPALLAPPKVRWTVYGFTIWAGLGGNLLLLSGTIKRVPQEVLESARLDGTGTMGELFKIIIPMIWPTLVTMFIMSMMGIFSVVFQPLFLTNSYLDDTATLGLWIFINAKDNSGNAIAATFGIMATIVVAPIVLITRWALDKMFANINY